MKEITVEQHFVKRCRAFGAWSVKGENVAGFPDRIMCAPVGRIAFVELKRPKGGVLSELQKEQHKRLRRLGFQVEVLWTKEEVDTFMTEFFGDRSI